MYRIFHATCVERNATIADGGGWSIPLDGGGGHDGSSLQPLRLCVPTLREKLKGIAEQFVFVATYTFSFFLFAFGIYLPKSRFIIRLCLFNY